jgi:hypothetical protein
MSKPEPESAALVECEWCLGGGTTVAFVDEFRDGKAIIGFRVVSCPACGGNGAVIRDHAERVAAGKERRAARLARGMTLLDEAWRLGISVVELSDIERGRKP